MELKKTILKLTKRILCIFLCALSLVSALPAVYAANAEPAQKKVLVSLGDSYSSGEGIEDFYGQGETIRESVKNHDWLAHRSELAWPGLLAITADSESIQDADRMNCYDKYDEEQYWFFVAASGATTKELYSEQKKVYSYYNRLKPLQTVLLNSEKLAPQLDVFDEVENKGLKTDYVTMTMGGNDAEFAKIVSTTLILNSGYLDIGLLNRKLDKLKNEKFPETIKPALEQAYRDIHEQAGDQACILIAGYPHIFDSKGSFGVHESEAKKVNKEVDWFNKEIGKIVESLQDEMNIVFIPVSDAFDDAIADPNNEEPLLYKFIPGTRRQDLVQPFIYSSYSFHPTPAGAKIYAECVQEVICGIETQKKEAAKEVAPLLGIWRHFQWNSDKALDGTASQIELREDGTFSISSGPFQTYRINTITGCWTLIEKNGSNYQINLNGHLVSDGKSTPYAGNVILALDGKTITITSAGAEEACWESGWKYEKDLRYDDWAKQNPQPKPEPEATKNIEPFRYSYRDGDHFEADVDGDGIKDTISVEPRTSMEGTGPDGTGLDKIDIITSSSGTIHFSTEDAWMPVGEVMGADLGDGNVSLILTIQATMTAPHIHAYLYQIADGSFCLADTDFETTLFTGYTDDIGMTLTVEPAYGAVCYGGTGVIAGDELAPSFTDQEMSSYLNSVEFVYNEAAQRYEVLTNTILYVAFHSRPLASGYTRYALENGALTVLEQWVEFEYDAPIFVATAADPASGDGYVHSIRLAEPCRYDLDGDGMGDDIWVSISGMTATLSVNGITEEPDLWLENPTGYYAVINADTTSDELLIGISDYGPSNDEFTHLFSYDGQKIEYIGKLPGIIGENEWGFDGVTCPGDGTFETQERKDILGTWFTPVRYRYADGELTLLTDFFAFEYQWEITVTCDLVMYSDLSCQNDGVIIPAGEMVSFTGVQSGSDGSWTACFDCGSYGDTLWIPVYADSWPQRVESTSGMISSTDAFDGFSFAD